MDALVKLIMNLHLFHTWGKWEKKKTNMCKTIAGVKVPDSDFVQSFQERKCLTCGKIEHEDLKYL